jgi:putative membrane protein
MLEAEGSSRTSQAKEFIVLHSLAAAATAFHGGAFFFPFFFIGPVIWLIIVVLIIAFAVGGRRRRMARWGAWGHAGFGPWGSSARSAESTLAERFAQGDIDEKEYRARLEVLRANNGMPQPGARS